MSMFRKAWMTEGSTLAMRGEFAAGPCIAADSRAMAKLGETVVTAQARDEWLPVSR